MTQKVYLFTGNVSNGNEVILPKTDYLFIKSKSTSQNESLIIYLDDNLNETGRISLEAGERKFYSSSRGFLLPRIKIIAGINSIVEYEYT